MHDEWVTATSPNSRLVRYVTTTTKTTLERVFTLHLMTFLTSFYNSLLLSVPTASNALREPSNICGYAGSCWKLAKSHVIFPLTSFATAFEFLFPFSPHNEKEKFFFFEERFLIKMPMWMPLHANIHTRTLQ